MKTREIFWGLPGWAEALWYVLGHHFGWSLPVRRGSAGSQVPPRRWAASAARRAPGRGCALRPGPCSLMPRFAAATRTWDGLTEASSTASSFCSSGQ